MKKILTAVFLTILSYYGYTQTLEPLEADRDYMIDEISVPHVINNSIIYTRNKLLNSSNNWIQDNELSICKIDMTNSVKTVKRLHLDTNQVIYLDKELKFYNNKFYTLAYYSSQDSILMGNPNQLYEPHIIIIDSSLNIVQNIAVGVGNVIAITMFDVVDDSTLLFSYNTNLTTFEAQHLKVHIPSGSITTIYNSNAFTLMRNWLRIDTIRAYCNHIPELFIFDNTYNIQDTVLLEPLADYSIDIKSRNPQSISDSEVLIRGIGSKITNTSQKIDVTYIYNFSSQTFKIIDSTSSTNVLNNYFYSDLTHLNKAHYFSGSIFESCLTNDFSNSSFCTNEIRISKYDSSGGLQWHQFIGNDAAYLGHSIIATPDSGCLVFVTRYDTAINNYENDIYYIKLDKDGNQQLNYLPTSSSHVANNLLQGVTLYPNPTNGTITLRYQDNTDFALTIYTLDGRTVRQGNHQFNQSIDVSRLLPGLYGYQIINKEGKTHSGTFVRE